jgi:hypothetical protein
MQDQSADTSPPVLERSILGAVGCCVASVPLAVGFSLWGFYVEESDQAWEVGYVLISIGVVVLFAFLIAAFGAAFVGIPVYLFASRRRSLRPPLLFLAAILVGLVVHETWASGAIFHGGHLFEDPRGAFRFALFGLYSGIAFWLGADVWRPFK